MGRPGIYIKYLVLVMLMGFPFGLCGQVEDDFADGNLDQQPAWQGDTSAFRVTGNARLRLDASANASPATLYTKGSFQQDTLEWRIWTRLDFAPSDQNQARFLLALDTFPGTSKVKGYWLQLGANGQKDGIDLYRKDAGGTRQIIDGRAGFLLKGPQPTRIRVRRYPGGQWKVAADSNGLKDWVLQGQTTDNTYRSFSYTGLEARFTSTRKDRFYFDHFYQGPFQPDTAPPALQNVMVLDSQSLRLRFSEPLAPGAANHFRLATGSRQFTATGPPDQRPSLLKLRISPPLANKTTYKLILDAIADTKGNQLTDTTEIFYVAPEPGDVQLTELMPDPTPSRGLPPVEYVEVYNNLTFPLNLNGWALQDPSNTGSIARQSTIPPKSSAVLAAAPAIQDLKQVGVKTGFRVLNMPTLNNGGETLTLVTDKGDTVDQVSYQPAWYQVDSLSDGGYSLAKINPLSPCKGKQNWQGSRADTGGTPGAINQGWQPAIDSVPPQVSQLQVVDSNQLKVYFDEPVKPDTSQSPSRFFGLQPNEPLSKAIVRNDTTIQLFTQQAFLSDTSYQLSVKQIPDCWGNRRQQAQTLHFAYVSPFGATNGAIVLNEIMPDPTPAQGLPRFEYVELANRSNRAFSLDGWRYGDDGTTARLPDTVLAAGEKALLVPAGALPSFAAQMPVISLASWPTLNNGSDALFLRAPSGRTIDTVAYKQEWFRDPNKADGGYSLERINPLSPCKGSRNWRGSQADSGGTPGWPNSVLERFRDSIPPAVQKWQVKDSNALLISFDEAIQRPLGRPLKDFFSLTPSIPLQQVAFKNDTAITIYYQQGFTTNLNYQLRVQGFPDCWGNQSAQAQPLSFTYVSPYGAEQRDIVFNEVLPDPTPSQGLPNFEYTELYNRTNQPISLRGWQYGDDSREVMLPDSVIPAKATLLLVPAEADTAFPDSLRRLPLTDWPTLNNGGDQLILKGPADKPIDSLPYDETWYANPVKADGGWALAQVNPAHPCGGRDNWRGSTDSSGGTPGRKNAVLNPTPDTTAPMVTEITVKDSLTLKVRFTEKVVTQSLEASNWQLSPAITVQAISPLSGGLTRNAVITLAAPMTNQQGYLLQYKGLLDCWGHRRSSPGSMAFTYLKPVPAAMHDLLVTEIMPAPEPTVGLPPYEYVELTNVSDKVLALQDLRMLVDSQSVRLPERLLKPDTSLVLTDPLGAAALLGPGQAIGVSGLPPLINAGGRITLRNQQGELVHTVAYRDDWYNGSFKEEGGWSLEMVDFKNPCVGDGNWRPSRSDKGGTPGQPNSVKGGDTDIAPPVLQQIRVVDSLTLRLIFSRRMDSLSLMQGDYRIAPDLRVEQVIPRTPRFRSVQLKLDQPAEQGTIYTFQVEGLKACAGQKLPQLDRRWGVPLKPEPGDLLINEILFNPSDNGADFVELYNNTDQVLGLDRLRLANNNDQGQIADPVTLPDGQVLPGEYLALTEKPAAVKDNFRVKHPRELYQMEAVPTYANDKGTVVLFRKDGTVLGEVNYLEDWHTPLIDDPAGVSLERISFQQPTDDPDNWQSAAETAGFGTPTYQNSQSGRDRMRKGACSLSSKVFSPDQDGYRDFLRLQYQLPKDGFLATIAIYDTKGRKVRQLTNNALLGRKGSLKWDGTRDNGSSVAEGVYILSGELFHPDGDKRSFRKSVTVGKR